MSHTDPSRTDQAPVRPQSPHPPQHLAAPQGPPADNRDPGRSAADVAMWVGFGALSLLVVGALLAFMLLQGRSTAAEPAVAAPPPPQPTPSPSATANKEITASLETPKDSPLYRLALNEQTKCPSFRVRTDEMAAPDIRPYLDSMLDCLMAMHTDEFTRNGMVLSKPALQPEDKLGESRCKSDPTNEKDWAGLYCSTDTTIYYRTAPVNAMELNFVMAHEFGHHLQKISGVLLISAADQQRLQRAPETRAQALEVSRRIELQADCLGASMIGGQWSPVTMPKPSFQLVQDAYSRSSEKWNDTHATGAAQGRWIARGAQAPAPNRYKACNTFTASADDVR